MAKVDKQMLRQDIKFPLKWDSDEYKLYLFDSEHNMIAMVYSNVPAEERTDHPFEKLIGEYKHEGGFAPAPPTIPKYSLYQGDYYTSEDNAAEPFGCVRGWGRLQYKDNPEQRQDNIANYILNVMNS
tara:strand:+ start:834 stop:1214 length:381 start_codon:yes stop_codon:yes gene_type:complete